jgi:hypothetical protein
MLVVAPAQRSFQSALGSLRYHDASLASLRAAGEQLNRASQEALAGLSGVSATATIDQEALRSARRLLRALAALGTRAAALPDQVWQVRVLDAQAIRGSESDASARYDDLSTALPGVVDLGFSPANRMILVVARAEQDRAMKLFLTRIQGYFGQSSQGREELVVVPGLKNNCAISPDDAAARLDSVARNRQSVLTRLSGLRVPDAAQARRIVDLFQRALRHSIEADRHFGDWARDLLFYYYAPPVGCPYGTPLDPNYVAAMSESGQATVTKQALVRSFDPLASRFGLKSDWTYRDI